MRSGTRRANTLLGTPAGDRLSGLRGNDVLRGLAGPDCLFGGPGRDRLEGGADADRVEGGRADRLAGGTGDDALIDRRGIDRFSGGAGNDRIDARDLRRRDRRRRDRIACGPGTCRPGPADRRDRVAKDCESCGAGDPRARTEMVPCEHVGAHSAPGLRSSQDPEPPGTRRKRSVGDRKDAMSPSAYPAHRHPSEVAICIALIAVVLATMSLTAGAAWGAARGLPGTGDTSFDPGPKTTGNHCVSPDGIDANAVLGISQPLLVPFACDGFAAGQFYVPFGPGSWTMDDHWGTVPPGYTPSAPTPAADYLSKLRTVTFVVDPGTAQARSYRYRAQDVVVVRNSQDFLPLSTPPLDLALALPKLPPVPPGDHRIAVDVEMSARHCDGLPAPIGACLPAGTTRLTVCPFRFEPRSALRSES